MIDNEPPVVYTPTELPLFSGTKAVTEILLPVTPFLWPALIVSVAALR